MNRYLKVLPVAVLSAIVAACTITTTDGTNDPVVTPDAGTPDTSTMPDTGMPDASTPDVSMPDASTPDTAMPDAADSGPIAAGCDFGGANNDRDNSAAIALNQTYTGLCIKPATSGFESDFYRFTTPADLSGGYVRIRFSNVSDGAMNVELFDATTSTALGSQYVTTSGASLDAYFSVAPNRAYRFVASTYGGVVAGEAGYTYDLDVAYTKWAESYEPNDIRADAKPMSAGTPIQAYYTAGLVPNASADVGDDWYSLNLASGSASVALSNVPTNLNLSVSLVDSTGTEVGSNYGANNGANVTVSGTVTAGTYYVRIGRFGGDNAASNGLGALPDNFTRPYTLNVTQ